MHGPFVNIDGERVVLDGIPVYQAGSLEDEARVADPDDIIDPDLHFFIHRLIVVPDVLGEELLHDPVAVLECKRQRGSRAFLTLFFDLYGVPAVIHVQDAPVPAADIVFKEYGGQHPLVDHSDHASVRQRSCLPLSDVFAAHKSEDFLGEIAEKPLAVFLPDLTLLLVKE